MKKMTVIFVCSLGKTAGFMVPALVGSSEEDQEKQVVNTLVEHQKVSDEIFKGDTLLSPEEVVSAVMKVTKETNRIFWREGGYVDVNEYPVGYHDILEELMEKEGWHY